MQLGVRGPALVELRRLGRELHPHLAELALRRAGTLGELGARDLETQRRLLERVRHASGLRGAR